VSQPTNLSYKVSDNGKIIHLELPKASWQRKNPKKHYIAGNIITFTNNIIKTSGSSLIFGVETPIRIKRPFFVSPSGSRGHRIVIDMIPAKKTINAQNYKLQTNMVASLSNVGAQPHRNNEVAQIAGSQNPYIQRAFPQYNQTRGSKNTPPTLIKKQPVPRQKANYRSKQRSKNFIDIPNIYSKGSLGLVMASESYSLGGDNDYNAEFSPGFQLSGAIGGKLDNGIRLEGELLYENAALKQISGMAAGSTFNTENVSGDINFMAFMGNVLYDIPMNSRLTPYVMGGVGFAGIKLDHFKPDNSVIANDLDYVFASQFGAGFAFDLDNRTKIEIGYRYLETQDPEFSDPFSTPFKSTYASHKFIIGTRIELK
jgi:opacity protein-like surface antigen